MHVAPEKSGGWGLISTHCCPQFQVWRPKFENEFKLHAVYWTLFWGFGAVKTSTTHWSDGRVQVWVQVRAPADQCRSSGNHSRRLFQKTIEGFDCKINGQALGAAGRTGEHKHRALPSRRQSLRAATGSLEENALPLLRYWLSSGVKKVLMLCRYRAATSYFFFICEMKLARSCRPKPRPSPRSILRSFIGLWVEIWHRNKTTCSVNSSKLNPVQSSRSKSTTCLRNGHLLRFE